MMRTKFSVVIVGVLSLGAFETAMADDACQTSGRLAQTVGTVMVDKGNGFAPGVVGTSLVSGNRISVLGQGQAVVDFGNQKTLTVPGSTTEIVQVPGCGFDLTNSGGMNPAVGIVGTLAVGAGLSAAISASDGKSGTVIFPVSP
ncbi:hypothetical protein [Ancylobacter sp. FA202]|uniref:hypothetical protein n=1 Tax=Ancylobacter sp. FA202 TaxID=1111106 RepID=UPI000381A975|nr:hypothetical protein [Ancylobacter sp. FA202]